MPSSTSAAVVAPASAVARVLADCANSTNAHKECVKLLWAMYNEEGDMVLEELLRCLNHVLLVGKGDSGAERVCRFLALFATHPNGRSEEECPTVAERIMTRLVGLAHAEDKAVRYRVCQLLASIFNNLPPDAEVTEELADNMMAAMLERMKDKVPQVRAQAARALARLVDPGEDPVTDAFLKTLSSDSNKDVRKCVLASIMPCVRTLPAMLERAQDVNDEVRRVVYFTFKDTMRILSVDQRVALLKRGLQDRTDSVKKAAIALLLRWLEHCNGDCHRLLAELDVVANEDLCCEVVQTLMSVDHISAVKASKQEGVTSGVPLLRGVCEAGELLSDEASLFWRVVCEQLNSMASSQGVAAASTHGTAAVVQAAAAGECLEALDRVLPATVSDLVQFISLHMEADGYGFAGHQLLFIAARCMDYTDGQGRLAAEGLVHRLMAHLPIEQDAMQKRVEGIEELCRQIFSSVGEMQSALLKIVDEFREGDDEAEDEGEGRWLCALAALASVLRQWPASPSEATTIHARTVEVVEGAMQDVVLPALESGNERLMVEGTRVLGLYCILYGQLQVSLDDVSTLAGFISKGAIPVRVMACRALCDLALFRGGAVRAFNVSHQTVGEEGDDSELPSVDVIAVLMGAMNGGLTKCGKKGDLEVCSVAAEGVMKLLFHQHMAKSAEQHALQDGDAVRAIVAMLLLYFAPSTEQCARLRQCLAVSFDHYPRLHPAHHRLMAAAFLPAARQAMLLSGGRKTTRGGKTSQLSASVIRFATQLLLMPVGEHQDTEGEPSWAELGHEELAESIIAEVLSAPKGAASKPYVAALCKALAALPLDGTALQSVKRLRVLAERMVDGATLDRATAKDAEAFRRKIAEFEEAFPGDPLKEEEEGLLLKAIEMHEIDPELLKLLEGESGFRGGRQAKGCGRRRATSSEDSDEEDDKDSVSANSGEQRTVTRQLPARRARTAARQNLAAAEQSDEAADDRSYSSSEDDSAVDVGSETRKGGSVSALDTDDEFQNPPSRRESQASVAAGRDLEGEAASAAIGKKSATNEKKGRRPLEESNWAEAR